MTYRGPAPPFPDARPSWRTRLTCAVLGHRWAAFKVHNPLMAHLSPTAGVDARCCRCGEVSMWRGTRYDEADA